MNRGSGKVAGLFFRFPAKDQSAPRIAWLGKWQLAGLLLSNVLLKINPHRPGVYHCRRIGSREPAHVSLRDPPNRISVVKGGG